MPLRGCTQLTFDFDRERTIKRLAGGIRELHPKRNCGCVARHAYRLCCEQLRSLSYPTYLAVVRELEDQ